MLRDQLHDATSSCPSPEWNLQVFSFTNQLSQLYSQYENTLRGSCILNPIPQRKLHVGEDAIVDCPVFQRQSQTAMTHARAHALHAPGYAHDAYEVPPHTYLLCQ
jgi:hypothetical protein